MSLDTREILFYFIGDFAHTIEGRAIKSNRKRRARAASEAAKAHLREADQLEPKGVSLSGDFAHTIEEQAICRKECIQ